MRSYYLTALMLIAFTPNLTAQDESLLPDAPLPRFERQAPARAEARLDRALTLFAWPGYQSVARDPSRLGQTEKRVLAVERLAFSFDLGTTMAVISPNSVLVERNAMNTLWGNRNRAGIASSMMGWEMSYSYAAAVLPTLPWSARMRKTIKVATIVLGGFLVEEHLRTGVCNLRLANKAVVTAADNCMLF